MAVTETTTVSWGSRIGDSLKGIVFGLVLTVVSIAALFWNEGRAVKTTQALEEGQDNVQCVEDNSKIDPAMEGKLVHMTGTAVTEDVLHDQMFGIDHNGIKLARKVQYYQWVEKSHTEEHKNAGGSVTKTTTYTYEAKWVDKPVDSSDFKEPGHANAVCMSAVASEAWAAENVTFGAFKLNKGQISSVDNVQTYSLSAYKAPEAISGNSTVAGDELYISWPSQVNGTIPAPAPVPGEAAAQPVTTADPANPRIGDMRVSWTMVSPKEDVSLVAVQRKDTFGAYVAKSSGYTVDLFSCGTKSAEEMFQDAHDANTMMTWLIRFGGWLVMFFAINMILKPISVVADVLPFLGNLAEVGLKAIAFFVSSVISLVVIAIAWIFYRPVLGIILLACVVALIVWYIKRKSGKKAAAAQQA